MYQVRQCSTLSASIQQSHKTYQEKYHSPWQPNTLIGLCGLAHAINTCYWEHRAEIPNKTGNSRSSVNKSDPKSDPTKYLSQSGNGSLQSKKNNKNSSSTQSKGSTSEQKEPTPNLLLKLRKDGKLMPQEHQCCLDNKLCLFCGTSGHIAKDYPKSSSDSSKSQAAKTDQESSMPSGLDSKKD